MEKKINSFNIFMKKSVYLVLIFVMTTSRTFAPTASAADQGSSTSNRSENNSKLPVLRCGEGNKDVRYRKVQDGELSFWLAEYFNSHCEYEVAIYLRENWSFLAKSKKLVLVGRSLDGDNKIDAWFYTGEDGMMEYDQQVQNDIDPWPTAVEVLHRNANTTKRWLAWVMLEWVGRRASSAISGNYNLMEYLKFKQIELLDQEIRYNINAKYAPDDPSLPYRASLIDKGWQQVKETLDHERQTGYWVRLVQQEAILLIGEKVVVTLSKLVGSAGTALANTRVYQKVTAQAKIGLQNMAAKTKVGLDSMSVHAQTKLAELSETEAAKTMGNIINMWSNRVKTKVAEARARVMARPQVRVAARALAAHFRAKSTSALDAISDSITYLEARNRFSAAIVKGIRNSLRESSVTMKHALTNSSTAITPAAQLGYQAWSLINNPTVAFAEIPSKIAIDQGFIFSSWDNMLTIGLGARFADRSVGQRLLICGGASVADTAASNAIFAVANKKDSDNKAGDNSGSKISRHTIERIAIDLTFAVGVSNVQMIIDDIMKKRYGLVGVLFAVVDQVTGVVGYNKATQWHDSLINNSSTAAATAASAGNIGNGVGSEANLGAANLGMAISTASSAEHRQQQPSKFIKLGPIPSPKDPGIMFGAIAPEELAKAIDEGRLKIIPIYADSQQRTF